MPELVTGASGFVGLHVARALRDEGRDVRLLLRPGSDRRWIAGLGAAIVEGDLRDRESVRAAVRGCSRVFHVAAVYELSSRDHDAMYRSNVDGTRHVLEACLDEGVQRVVYTSSVGALATGPESAIANEDTPVALADVVGHYKRSKFLAQEVAIELAGRGLPVVIVNPSTPIGPFDARPTPTGKMLIDFLNRRMPAYVDTGLNFVAVEDVAKGHLLAADRGSPGQKYILGGENLHLRDFLALLGRVSGLEAPTLRIPHWVAGLAAACSEAWAFATRGIAAVPLESVRLSRSFMYFDSAKARRELGFTTTPLEPAIDRAVRWYREQGYAPRSP